MGILFLLLALRSGGWKFIKVIMCNMVEAAAYLSDLERLLHLDDVNFERQAKKYPSKFK